MNILDQHQLTANPGLAFALQSLSKQLAPKRQIKAVKTDTQENPARCYTCRGDNDNCPTCNGQGDLPELESVDMVVYRDFMEVPVQVSIRNGEVLDAYAVANVWGDSKSEQPFYAEGESVTLSLEEKGAALDALRAKPEAE